MATNKNKVRPNPEFLTDAQAENRAWTETTGSVEDGAKSPPTGPRKKSDAGPLKTEARRKTDKKRSGA